MKKTYVVFGANAVMLADNYERALLCCNRYFRSPRYIKGFYSREEANEAATDHLWDIAPLDRFIPEKLALNKVYSAWKLPKND